MLTKQQRIWLYGCTGLSILGVAAICGAMSILLPSSLTDLLDFWAMYTMGVFALCVTEGVLTIIGRAIYRFFK